MVSPYSILNKPRHDAVEVFCLSTGHGWFATQLHHIGISTDHICPLLLFLESVRGLDLPATSKITDSGALYVKAPKSLDRIVKLRE
ncbi:hypothetical protein NPIL_171961 [Nephila pilipes]|uniref:Uncharacterized protein n=1 Tax=Nephila pilipes TaxID=299642 RepID=A0A8X6TJL1_NEPPI|nr:hypothetical protein NPIL_171961 [Nephila pilipes]